MNVVLKFRGNGSRYVFASRGQAFKEKGTIMKDITLIGMPGSGKSTIGVLLAKALGMDFLDADLVIQKREGALLQEILDKRGFDAFKKAEEEALLSIHCGNTVIATGGSAVYSAPGMKHLKEQGVAAYLELTLPEIRSRLFNLATRGIAFPPGKTLEDIYRERAPLYEKYADITVNGTGKVPEEMVALLKEALKKEGASE